MELTLVDFYKICGILFFIVMCWYFVFVVFKTNKDLLNSLVHESDEPSSLEYVKKMFGNDSLVEGFKEGMSNTDKLKEYYANKLEKEKKQLIGINRTLHIDDDGKEEIRNLIMQVVKQRRELWQKYGVWFATIDGQKPEDLANFALILKYMNEVPEEYEKIIEDSEY